MNPLKTLVYAAFLAGLGAEASAADFSDPTWPCVQRKVENLSIGLMWPYPIDVGFEASDEQKLDIAHLSESLSLRRIPLDELEPQVAEFATKYDGDADMLGQVFSQVFNGMSNRRTRIINGIGDFSLSQIALSEQIDKMRVEMDQQLAADEPDYDRVDALEEQLDWDQLIYTDRQQSITYLCETPTLLEKRLYGISQILAQAVRSE